MDAKPPNHQWPLQPLALKWLRGPAWADHDDIVIDRTRATTYHPFAEPEIGIALARVRTPDDAVAFVERFGLLGHPYSAREQKAPPQLREPFRDFELAADDLREILATARLVRHGANGDTEALAQLRNIVVIPEDHVLTSIDGTTGKVTKRRAGDAYSPEERFVGADDRTIVMYAHEYYVAQPLTEGIADAPLRLHDHTFIGESVPPGSLGIRIQPESLTSVCYLSVALALADKQPVGICVDPTCERPFFITDRRQRFCSRTCGNRVRLQRFKEKKGGATTPKEGD